MIQENDNILSSISEDGTIKVIPKNRTFRDALPEINMFVSSDDTIKNSEKPFRKDLKLPQSRTFLVDNLLTKEECQFYIEESNRNGYKTIEKEFPTDYRNNTRYIGRNEKFVEILYKRLQPFFVTEDLEGVKPYGFDQQGIWIPIGLSNCLIFSRYESGGKFKAHYDSTYVQNPDKRSIYTIQIYLNDDYEGGQTNFFENTENPLESSNLKQLGSVQPKTGTALVFNHDTLHEGAQVTSGVKYIVRLYMMFIRIDQNYDITETQRLEIEQATNLFYEAECAEKDTKDINLAIQLFVKGQMMLLKYPSIRDKPNDSSQFESLPDILLFQIVIYLPLQDIGSILNLNRHLNELCKKNQLWKQLYIENFSYQSYQIEDSVFNSFIKLNLDKSEPKNWYLTYKTVQSSLMKEFVCLDFGSEFIKFCDNTGEYKSIYQRASEFKQYSHHHNTSTFPKVSWIIGSLNRTGKYYSVIQNGEINMELSELMFDYVRKILYRQFTPRKDRRCAIILPISPKMYHNPTGKDSLKFIEFYQIPSYYMNSGLLVLQSHGLTSGTVVMFGAGHTIVVPFIDGVQLDRISEFPITGNKLKEYIYDLCQNVSADEQEIPLQKRKWFNFVRLSNNWIKEVEESVYDPKICARLSPEIYFKADLLGEKGSIVQHTHQFIKSFDPDTTPTKDTLPLEHYHLLQNVVITGGISQITNFTERFSSELKKLNPNLNIIYSHDRFNDVLKGTFVNNALPKSLHSIYQPPPNENKYYEDE